MRRAALFVHGRIVVGMNHGDAFGQLTEIEQSEFMVSGFYDPETEEFTTEDPKDHFYNKELCLVRHAEAKDQTDPDTDISTFGEEQAQQVGSFVAENFQVQNFTGITSPLLRCLRTAQIIQELSHLKFEVDPRVMETPPVDFHLKNHKDRFPQFEWSTNLDWDLCPESPPLFLQRIRSVLHNIPHRCIIVTHMGTICNMSRLALCEQKAQKVIGNGLPPASVTCIEKQDVRCLTYENFIESRPASEQSKD